MDNHLIQESYEHDYCINTQRLEKQLDRKMDCQTNTKNTDLNEKPRINYCQICKKKLKFNSSKNTGNKNVRLKCSDCQYDSKSCGKNTNIYKCIYCIKKFRHPIEFKNHLKTHFDDNSDFICTECDRKFLSVSSLSRHIVFNHNNKDKKTVSTKPSPKVKPQTRSILKVNLFAKTKSTTHNNDDDKSVKNKTKLNENKSITKHSLDQYPNIEVVKIKFDENDEQSMLDDLNLRYVLFKDRILISDNAINN